MLLTPMQYASKHARSHDLIKSTSNAVTWENKDNKQTCRSSKTKTRTQQSCAHLAISWSVAAARKPAARRPAPLRRPRTLLRVSRPSPARAHGATPPGGPHAGLWAAMLLLAAVACIGCKILRPNCKPALVAAVSAPPVSATARRASLQRMTG